MKSVTDRFPFFKPWTSKRVVAQNEIAAFRRSDDKDSDEETPTEESDDDAN